MSEHSVLVLADGNAARRSERHAALTASGLSDDDLLIYEAARGTEALEFVALHNPDAVLLDIELPDDPDGIDVYARLKADVAFTAPVILAIPRSAPEARKAAAFACGADAYIVEPEAPEALAATVRSALRLGWAERRLSAANASLRAAQAEIEQFASQVCHDVEEPLRAVTTFVELVEERGPDSLTENERAYLGHVLAASARVRGLLRGFSAYTQAGCGRRAHFGRLDLRGPAYAAVQSLRKRVEESQTSILFEEPWPPVWGDFAQLQQVFEQVIGNAINYRAPGSAPTITIGAKPASGAEWIVAVADRGMGIAAGFHSSIFLPFKRLHGREIPGAGMGLAISRRIVEAHGGRMWVESSEGRGAVFCFSLRALESGTPAEQLPFTGRTGASANR